MGRITSSIGLITGTEIDKTVDQLVALAAQPRERLTAKQKTIQEQQIAVAELTSLTIAIKLAANRIGASGAFAETTVSSSNSGLLAVRSTGTPPVGGTSLTPLRTAAAQQSLSSGVADRTAALGGGTITLSNGGSVSEPMRLDDLRGGAGIAKGSIRLTDRQGAAAIVDLSGAVTIDDVVTAINSQTTAGVTAGIENDRLVLTDRTGGTGNLRVDNVGAATTATDLGLAGVHVATDTAFGTEIAFLSPATRLDRLLDGKGIQTNAALPELRVQFANGSSDLILDFPRDAKTLGDLLNTFNAADPSRLEARIAADGDRIELIDKTGGGLSAVLGLNGSNLGDRLGLTTTTGGAVVSGSRLHSGLSGKLTATLGGGQGLGPLGTVTVTDRSGASATVDLANAETLDDIRSAFRASGLGIEVTTSQQGNGLAIRDISGGGGTLSIVSSDATETAEKLRLTTSSGAAALGGSVLDGGSLGVQTVFRTTKLTDLPGGVSATEGRIAFTDSRGREGTLDLGLLQPQTVGDLIDGINSLGLGIRASINATGDGIALNDSTSGTGAIIVTDLTGSTAAKSLRLAGTSTTFIENNQAVRRIDGRFATTITLEPDQSLDDLAKAINDAKAGLTASIINDGSPDAPYRLVLTSTATGRKGVTRADLSELGLTSATIVEGRDAILRVGGGANGTGLVLTSSTNTFKDVVPGVEVNLLGADGSSVDVNVAASQSRMVTNITAFVEQLNKVREKVDELGAFNPLDGTRGLLQGSGDLLRIDAALRDILTQPSGSSGGSIRTLQQIGISLNDQGQVRFDETKFRAAFTADPTGVEAFFTTETTGLVARVEQITERLNGLDGSVLLTRSDTLQRQLETVNSQIETWNSRLQNQRNRLLVSFYQMEMVIGQMQTSLNSLASLQSLITTGR